MYGKRNKSPDFELNLLPIISILAVVLSILLMTAVWVNIGTFNLNQALGTETIDSKENPPALWVQLENDGGVKLAVKDAKVSKSLQSAVIKKNADKLSALRAYAKKLKEQVPNLNVALILPSEDSNYQDVIAVMDSLKKEKITDLGIAPL